VKAIIITVHEEGDSLAVTVDVDAGFTTPEAIGYLEIAKQQHLQAKHRNDLCASVEQTPDTTEDRP
jgi:hypothetical protein